jgi:hypothetical protein
MKTTVLLLLSWVTLCRVAQAQMSIIPKAGVTFSSIDFNEDPIDGKKTKTGLVIGAGLNLPVVEDFFSIQPELLYIQKGMAYEGTLTDPDVGNFDYELNQTINYLEIPVLAKISFGGDAFKAYVNAGPSLGLGLGGKSSIKFAFGNQTEEEDEDVKFGSDDDADYDNRIELGAQFGGGIGYKIGPGALLLDIRYGLGLSNLYKADDDMSSDEAKSKNRVIAISLGYAIPFGGK